MHTHTHTHTRPFYGSMDFVRDNLVEPVPEETFTHSHLLWSSVIPYLLPSIINLHTKLEVSMFTYYEDMKGNKNAEIEVVWEVRGHRRSLANVNIRAHTTSYLTLTETMHLS